MPTVCNRRGQGDVAVAQGCHEQDAATQVEQLGNDKGRGEQVAQKAINAREACKWPKSNTELWPSKVAATPNAGRRPRGPSLPVKRWGGCAATSLAPRAMNGFVIPAPRRAGAGSEAGVLAGVGRKAAKAGKITAQGHQAISSASAPSEPSDRSLAVPPHPTEGRR